MAKIFNVNGPCKPDKHYVVDLRLRLDEIKKMIEAGEYFVTARRGSMERPPYYELLRSI